MKLPVYHVDAFSSRLFSGNPAAICPLEAWLPDATMQSIAAEHNLSETAFYVRLGDGRYGLRWFTPQMEVDLCGHATLATAHVMLSVRRDHGGPRIIFDTKSGEMAVETEGDRYVLDFPSRPPQPSEASPAITEALGAQPESILTARDCFCVFPSEKDIVDLKPDMAKLAALDFFGVVVTAQGSDCDFVSRFFAPAKGVPEDPVTGSAHCSLIPYWAKRLKKSVLFGRQISRRGGEIWCEDRGNRVKIGGHAILFSEGVIDLP